MRVGHVGEARALTLSITAAHILRLKGQIRSRKSSIRMGEATPPATAPIVAGGNGGPGIEAHALYSTRKLAGFRAWGRPRKDERGGVNEIGTPFSQDLREIHKVCFVAFGRHLGFVIHAWYVVRAGRDGGVARR